MFENLLKKNKVIKPLPKEATVIFTVDQRPQPNTLYFVKNTEKSLLVCSVPAKRTANEIQNKTVSAISKQYKEKLAQKDAIIEKLLRENTKGADISNSKTVVIEKPQQNATKNQ